MPVTVFYLHTVLCKYLFHSLSPSLSSFSSLSTYLLYVYLDSYLFALFWFSTSVFLSVSKADADSVSDHSSQSIEMPFFYRFRLSFFLLSFLLILFRVFRWRPSSLVRAMMVGCRDCTRERNACRRCCCCQPCWYWFVHNSWQGILFLADARWHHALVARKAKSVSYIGIVVCRCLITSHMLRRKLLGLPIASLEKKSKTLFVGLFVYLLVCFESCSRW